MTADEQHYSDVEWFEKTSHCGKCGSPGDFCFCTDRYPCGCRHLHVMGSARLPDPLASFSSAPVVDVEQPDLFGDGAL